MLEPNFFHWKMPRYCKTAKGCVKFWFRPLNMWPCPFFSQKTAEIEQKVIAFFPGKGRGDRALILTYLDSSMAKVFSSQVFTFFDFGHLQGGNGRSQSDQKWTLWVHSFFVKIRISGSHLREQSMKNHLK